MSIISFIEEPKLIDRIIEKRLEYYLPEEEEEEEAEVGS